MRSSILYALCSCTWMNLAFQPVGIGFKTFALIMGLMFGLIAYFSAPKEEQE